MRSYAVHPETAIESQEENPPSSQIAKLLRLFGTIAVMGSAVIYMVQGLSDSDVTIRNWIYLLMMLTLGLGGVFSVKAMQDTKGARLFFALAAALVAVQTSQLAAMIYQLFALGPNLSLGMFQVPIASAGLVGIIGAAGLLISVPVAFAGFSILSRPHAKALSLSYLGLNVLMLLPVREFPFGTIIIAAMAGVYLLLESRIFSRSYRYSTLEGAAVRGLLLLPTMIVSARACFYLSDLLGLSVLAAIAAGCALALRNIWQKHRCANEAFTGLFFVLGAVAIIGIVSEVLGTLMPRVAISTLPWFAYSLPLIGLAVWASCVTSVASGLYRVIAMAMTLLLTACVWSQAGPVVFLVLCLLGSGLLFWGMAEQRKLQSLIGGGIAIVCFAAMLASSFNHVSINSWLLLAVVGVAFVALSSVLEKHGRKWLQAGKNYAQAFAGWPL